MKRVAIILAFSLLVFISCTSMPDLANSPPDWLDQPQEAPEGSLMFRGYGEGNTYTAAKENAADNLVDQILDAMNLGDPDSWIPPGKSKINAFREEWHQAFRYSKFDNLAERGVTPGRGDGWHRKEGGYGQALEVLWEESAFVIQRLSLLEMVNQDFQNLRIQEKKALEAENRDEYYESALLWSRAAGMAGAMGDVQRRKRNLAEVEKVLGLLEYTGEVTSDSVTVGSFSNGSAVFRIFSTQKGVSNAAFVVKFPRLNRDGTESQWEAMVFSDENGYIQFPLPLVEKAGVKTLTLAPSARPFLDLSAVAEASESSSDFVAAVQKPRVEVTYEALPQSREIGTGILLLETDLAGNALDAQAAALGILETLKEEGFAVSLMPLDPKEIDKKSDAALLRDLKADGRFSGKYGRVIFGVVSLDGFEEVTGGYSVKAVGKLRLGDISRQVILLEEVLTKSSQASDGQQAILAAFRQLGRAFARLIIDETL